MAAPVKINFRAGGVAEVVNAFKTVAKATRDAEKQVEILSTRRERANRAQVADTKRSEEKIRNEQEKTADKAIKEVHREMQERFKIRTAREKHAAYLERLESNAAKRAADKQIAEAKRVSAAKEREAKRDSERKARDAKRDADRNARESERQQKYLLGLRQRHYMQEQRDEERNAKTQAMKQRIAERQRMSIARDRASTVVSSIGGMISGAGRLAGAALTLGGGFTVADAISEDVKLRGKAKALEIMSGGEASAGQLIQTSKDAGIRFGQSAVDTIDALDRFAAKSGKVKDGMNMLKDLVEIATATGADLGELATTAGIVHMTTGSTAGTVDVMRQMAGMGRAGSIDLRDLQMYGGRISAASNLFEDKGKAMKAIGAIAQQSAATGGSVDAAEATMSVQKLGTDLLKHEQVLKDDYKINIRGNDGKLLRDPYELIKELVVATNGDFGKIHGVTNERSFRAFSGFAAAYNEGAKGKTGEEARAAGVAAMDAKFKVFIDAIMTEAQTKKDAAARMTETDKQLQVALQQLRTEVGERLTPKFVELVPHLTRLVPTIVHMTDAAIGLINFLQANPFTGIGAAISGKILADLGAAAIGQAVKGQLATLIGSGLATIAIPLMIGTIGKAVIDIASAETVEKQRKQAISAMTAGQLPTGVAERIRAGTATKEDADAIEAQRVQVTSRMTALQKESTKPSLLSTAVGLVSQEGKEAVDTEYQAQLREVQEYKMGLAELGRAASDVARQLKEAQPNRSKPFGAQ